MISTREIQECRRTQLYYVNTAVVQKTLRETTVLALQVLDKMMSRSEQLEETETRGADLVRQSERFAAEAERWNKPPWWKRLLLCECIPRWWFTCQPSTVKQQKCRRKQRAKSDF